MTSQFLSETGERSPKSKVIKTWHRKLEERKKNLGEGIDE